MRAILAATLLCFTLSFSTNSFSDEHEACQPDAQKFCAGVERGGGRIAKCLHKNKEALSEPCKAMLKEAKKNFKDVIKACRADKRKFCKEAKQDRHAVMTCFKEHEAELSAECKKEIQDLKTKHQEK